MMQELSLNILDIAQNSISAGASVVEISIEEDSGADRLTITISDDGRGMSGEQIKNVIDPFYTTRTTRKVGLGVPFFKMAAELAGGSFDIKSETGAGTVVTAVFGLTNIDRMPLGDVAETVCMLIQFNPGVDFIYRLVVDGRETVTDTREYRAIFEDIPIESPDVIQAIKETINSETVIIRGGKNINEEH